jgi:hypothetical protein
MNEHEIESMALRDDRAALWEKSHRQDDAIISLSTAVASTQTEVKGLIGTLQGFMEQQRDNYSDLKDAITGTKTPLMPFVLCALAILGMMGTFGAWVVGGTQRENDLRFEASTFADEAMRRESDLRFQAESQITTAQSKSIEWLVGKVEQSQKDLMTMAFEGGKQQQKLEDLTLFTRRMDLETQDRLRASEGRLTSVETSASTNAAVTRILSETQQANINRILNEKQQTP